MIIRCERCSTMYELDESLLAPGGSQVQCTKCQHVFTAFPPGAPGRTLAGMPPAPAPEHEHEAEPEAPRSAPARSAPAAREPSAPRPARTGPPPVYRPPASGAPVRAPVLKRDTVGAFEARLRWSARWRWLGPALAVGLLAVVAGAWFLLSRASGPAQSDARAEALALIALDDAASLDAAAQKLGAVRGRRAEVAAADRALALVLRAAVVADERDSLVARLAAASEERERQRREAAPGAVDSDPGAPAVAGLEREVRARDEQLRALSAAAADQLRAAQAAGAGAPEVTRAAASLHALRGEREQAERILRAAEGGRRDAWLDLADGWIDALDPERSVRERALVKLGRLASARPDLLRGRYLLARAEASLGRRAEARTSTEAILSANRRHEGARRLREELAAPPAAPAAAVATPPAPTPAPPPAEQAVPAPQRRKAVPQPGPRASPSSAPSPGGDAAPDAASAPGASPGDAAAPPGAPETASPGASPGEHAPPADAPAGAPPAAPRPPRPAVEPLLELGSSGG